MAPVRIQRKRTKGWKAPEGAVYVGRGTVFGNPIKVTAKCPAKHAAKMFRRMMKMSQMKLMESIKFEDGSEAPMDGLAAVIWRQTVLKRLPELRGKDLMCFCALDQPCHADMLLEWANK